MLRSSRRSSPWTALATRPPTSIDFGGEYGVKKLTLQYAPVEKPWSRA
jgi:hypothetical protein